MVVKVKNKIKYFLLKRYAMPGMSLKWCRINCFSGFSEMALKHEKSIDVSYD